MKRIKDNHQDMWGYDHKIVRTEWKCALAADCTSFEMRRMATRTDQLIHIAIATVPKFTLGSQRQRLKACQRPWSCP